MRRCCSAGTSQRPASRALKVVTVDPSVVWTENLEPLEQRMWTVARSPESAAGASTEAPSSAMIGDRKSEF